MDRSFLLPLMIASLAAPALLSTDARACKCGPPDVQMLTPNKADDVPLNTRVRFEVPRSRAARRVLRAVGSTVEVSVVEQVLPDGEVNVVELSPRAALQPSTRYEVALIDPSAQPGTVVFGTFKTGTAADNAAPVVKSAGTVEAHRNVDYGGGDCSIRGPWVDVRAAAAEDPSRPKAQILWGVWTKDASGKIDASKPPSTILSPWRDTITIGQRNSCDPRGFPVPDTGVFTFGLAPLDEAGNAGPLKIHRVDMSAATPQRP
jgi:hypothetical protein